MVREVYGGTVVLVGADRVWTVRPGGYIPGLGRIDTITRWGSRWIVVTTSGVSIRSGPQKAKPVSETHVWRLAIVK
jgi:hypothetical protein